MNSSQPKRTVRLDDDPLVDWVSEPVFEFETEVDALKMLQALSDELRSAREQVRHAMRYMGAAVQAARTVVEDGKPVSKQAITRESGLSRRTVYAILGQEEAVTPSS
jgi:hypothetical protein